MSPILQTQIKKTTIPEREGGGERDRQTDRQTEKQKEAERGRESEPGHTNWITVNTH